VDEMKAVSSTGTRHIDFPISANRDLTDVQLDQLTALLRDAQQPVLVHCEGGADRSGLASAI
jgi:protein tyrosine/serine phosphatase